MLHFTLLLFDMQVVMATVSCVEKRVTCQGTVLVNPEVQVEGVVEAEVATNAVRKATWQETARSLVVVEVEVRVASTVEKMGICQRIALNHGVKAEAGRVTIVVGMVTCQRIAQIPEQMVVVVVEVADPAEKEEVICALFNLYCLTYNYFGIN
jgi:hypothetical protein